MSRSYKKTPISGITGAISNKPFKKQEHRRERRAVNCMLHTGKEVMPHPKKYGNEWSSPRDGKSWFGDLRFANSRTICKIISHELYLKALIENKLYYIELMRK